MNLVRKIYKFLVIGLLLLPIICISEESVLQVKSITLSETDIMVMVGQSKTIKAAIEPTNAKSKDLLWSSTEESIATVINGRIEGKSNGECDILCKSNDGSELTAICHVQVKTEAKSITFAEKKITLVAGIEDASTTKIIYNINPENASWQEVSWSSSNEAIVSVDANGYAIGLNPGTARVTVQVVQPTRTIRAQIPISVIHAVENISLSKTELSIPINKRDRINASVLPANAGNKKLLWESSDESIATVDNGSVLAIGVGECDIVCKTTDGSGVETSCHVCVTQPVEKIYVESNKVIVPAQGSIQPEILFEPKNASDKSLIWKSSNESICTVNQNGIIYGLKPGNCQVTIKTKDGSNKTITLSVHVSTLDLKEHKYDVLLTNPARADFIPIDYRGLDVSEFDLEVDNKSALSDYFLAYSGGLYITPAKEGDVLVTIYKKSDKNDYTKYRLHVFNREKERASVKLNNVWLKINYNLNFFFSKYDIDVFLDDTQKLERMENGKSYKWSALAVEPGIHKLAFYKADDRTLSNEIELNINGQTNEIINVWAKRDRIEIKAEETPRNKKVEDKLQSKVASYDSIVLKLKKQYDYIGTYTNTVHEKYSMVYVRILLLGKDNEKYIFLKGKKKKMASKWDQTIKEGLYIGNISIIGSTLYAVDRYDGFHISSHSSDDKAYVFKDFRQLDSSGIEIYMSYAYPELYSTVANIMKKW